MKNADFPIAEHALGALSQPTVGAEKLPWIRHIVAVGGVQAYLKRFPQRNVYGMVRHRPSSYIRTGFSLQLFGLRTSTRDTNVAV